MTDPRNEPNHPSHDTVCGWCGRDHTPTIERVSAVFQGHFGQQLLDRFAEGKVTFQSATDGRRVELDSLDQTEFVMALEEEFGVTITDEQGERVTSIKEAAALIDELTAEAVNG